MTPEQLEDLERSKQYEMEAGEWQRKIDQAYASGKDIETIRWYKEMRGKAEYSAHLNKKLAHDRGY